MHLWFGETMESNPVNKKPTMIEASKKVMGLMEKITAREIIVRLKESGRKELPTPRQLSQKFRSDPDIESIKSKKTKEPTVFRRLV